MANIPSIFNRGVWSTNSSGEPLGGNNFKYILSMPTLANNCGKFRMYYPSGATISSITDDAGNTYPTTPDVSITDTTNNIIFGIFHKFGLAAGGKVITVVFSAVQFGVCCSYQELNNIATSAAVDGAAVAAFNVGATPNPGRQAIGSGGSYTPTTNGDIIFHEAMDTGAGSGGFSAALSGGDNVVSITSDPAFTFADLDQIQGYFSEYQVQPVAMAVNPQATVQGKLNSGWASITYGLKTAAAGNAPSATAKRIALSYHFHMDTVNGTFTYPLPIVSEGTMIVVAISDPGGSTTLNSLAGAFAGAGVVRTNTSSNAQMGYIKHGRPSPNEVLTLGANDAAHGYYQGVLYCLANISNFDTDVDLALAGFGPGNSPSASITPGVSNGETVNVTGLGTGPPDSMSSPASGRFMSTFYTNETDLSPMDNGDFHGTLDFSTNAAQSWILHDTAATANAGAHIATFTLGPIITAQPTNQTAYPGQSITFSATATASGGSNTYQWYKNGSLITGATSSSYTFSPNWQADYGATWYCIVTDSNGSTQTVPVQVVWVPESSLSFNLSAPGAARASYAGYVQLNAFDVGDQDYKSELTVLRWF